MTLSYRSGVSIGEIIVYIPILLVAVILAVLHGFRRNTGWLFLIIFSLARIIGPCFQLETIHDPTNTDLYTGAAILQSVGLSPLMLAALGLLSRVITSINRHRSMFPNSRQLMLVHLIVTVGLILGILGGIDASDKLKQTGTYVPQGKSKAGVVVFIIAYVLIFLTTVLTAINVSHAEPGEKRLLLAAALALPFLLVRLVYSGLSTFDSSSKTFNQVSGNVTVWLIMALIMELIVVIIYEGTGLTLRRSAAYERPDTVVSPMPPAAQGFQPQGEPGYGTSAQSQEKMAYYENGTPSKGRNLLETLGQRTIIGRLVTKAMNKDDDVEMQQQPQRPYGLQ